MDEGPRVVNIRTEGRAACEVYVGRPTKWGNPFVIGQDGTRAEVVRKFRERFLADEKLVKAAKAELKGKTLGCYCAPELCHADVLLEVANG